MSHQPPPEHPNHELDQRRGSSPAEEEVLSPAENEQDQPKLGPSAGLKTLSPANQATVIKETSPEITKPNKFTYDALIDLQLISIKTLLLILDHSPYYEVFKLRKVSKSWLKAIDYEFKPKELIIFLKQFPFNDVWSFSNDPLEIRKALKINKLNYFFKSSQTKIFKNIERLSVYNFPSDYEQVDIELLNQFANLTHLELKNLKLKDQGKLILPNLKSLCLFKQSSGKVRIDAPLLTKFKTSINLSHFKIEHPQSIEYLECTHFNSCIKSFTNLEYLYVEFISHLSSLFLEKMTKLKEIQFFDFGVTNNVFNSLKKQKKKYDRKELNIFYLGINFDHYPETDFKFEKFNLNDYNLHYYADHYKGRLATTVPFIRKINYNSMIKRFNEIPKDLHVKFPNIGCVTVENKLNNLDLFLKFLHNCKALRILSLKNSSLDQKHLDILPIVAQSLTYLTLEQESSKFNYNFILKLKNLIKFQVDQFVAFNLVQQSFEKLHFLKSFFFRIQSGTILIKKSNYYLLIISNSYQDCFNNLENLIKVLKKNYGSHK